MPEDESYGAFDVLKHYAAKSLKNTIVHSANESAEADRDAHTESQARLDSGLA